MSPSAPGLVHELHLFLYVDPVNMLRKEIASIPLTWDLIDQHAAIRDTLLNPQRRSLDMPDLSSSSPVGNAYACRAICLRVQLNRQLWEAEVAAD